VPVLASCERESVTKRLDVGCGSGSGVGPDPPSTTQLDSWPRAQGPCPPHNQLQGAAPPSPESVTGPYLWVAYGIWPRHAALWGYLR
jgi:hypothetical protein